MVLKIMMVDDEMSVLKGMEHILKKHCPNYEIVSMVNSAMEALHVIKKTEIDVVITDVMMPEMNGVELTKAILKDYPQMKVIVLSGHADYEFVRHAMKNGAFDYLLKPCSYQTILEILNKIEKQLVDKETENHKIKQCQLLKDVLEGKQPLPKEWSIQPNMSIAVVTTNGNVDSHFENCFLKELQNLTDSQWVETLLLDNQYVLFYRNSLDLSVIKKKLYKYRQKFSSADSSIQIAYQSMKKNNHSMKDAYEICNRMIEFMEFNNLFSVMDDGTYSQLMQQQKSVSMTDYFSGKAIARMIVGSEDRKILDYIDTRLIQLYQLDVYIDPVRIKREIICEIVFLEQEIKAHGIEPEYGQQRDIIEEIKNMKTLREMLDLLKRLPMSMLAHIQTGNEYPHYIRAAIKYIEVHYMEDLSLQMVADAVYLNPWYFSSQFKKFTSKSFSEYLNQVRVRIAKELLHQKDLKVYQVAEMVGFQDAAYFSTVFRNVENMSPKEYQKSV